MSIEEKIKPFYLVDQSGNGASLCLEAGVYKQELFETREDEGFLGNGYDWASLATVFLEEKMPELLESIEFDPEAGMFCAYSSDKADLQRFATAFKEACENNELINDLFSRAELD